MWWMILLGLGWPVALLAIYVAYRYYKSAEAYDNIFQFIAGDIATNILYLAETTRKNVMMEDPTIQTVHRNLKNMGRRLEEILRQMEETSGLRLRPEVPKPRPKVVD
jgi:hypothetical protein